MKIRTRIHPVLALSLLAIIGWSHPTTQAQDSVGSELWLLARTGLPAPGGGTFVSFSDPAVGSLNQFAFVGTQAGSASANSTWMGRLNGSGISLIQHLRLGQVAPGFAPETFREFLQVAVSPTSGLAVSGGANGASNPTGLWRQLPSSPLQFVAGSLTPVIPDTGFSPLGPPNINSAGTLAIKGDLTGLLSPSSTNAVFVGTPGNFAPILKVGDNPPGFPINWTVATLYGLSYYLLDAGTTVSINDAGMIAFGAVLNDPDFIEFSAIFYGSPSNFLPIAVKGNPAPGYPGWSINALFPEIGLSQNGSLAFAGEIISDTTTEVLSVLFAGPANALAPILFENTEVTPGSGIVFDKFGNAAINQRGDIVFSAEIRYPNNSLRPSIWIKRSGEAPVLLAATGVSFTGPTGLPQPATSVYFAGHRAFNDFYQAVFRVGFTGGAQSLFLAQTRPGIPVVRVTAPNRRGQVTTRNSVSVGGTATNLSGIARVEYTVTPTSQNRRASRKIRGLRGQNKRTPRIRKFLKNQSTQIATGTENWSFSTPLAMGRNVIRVNAIDVTGGVSETVRFAVIRYSATPVKRLASKERRKLLRMAKIQARRTLNKSDRL